MKNILPRPDFRIYRFSHLSCLKVWQGGAGHQLQPTEIFGSESQYQLTGHSPVIEKYRECQTSELGMNWWGKLLIYLQKGHCRPV